MIAKIHRGMYAQALVCFAILFILVQPPLWSQDLHIPLDSLLATPLWSHPEAFIYTENLDGDMGWPLVKPEAKPGSYWWWPGSAVTREDLSWNMETYQRAGWGNLGIIGIYGVKGEEQNNLEIFSREWFKAYNHAVSEAERLGMNVDLTPSSGWRLGGSHVTTEFAEQSFEVVDGDIEVITRSDQVKRAGPGGKGLCINPYSETAVSFHFNWLSERFREGKGLSPRAFYYDSFENPGNWCSEFYGAFEERRGYDLNSHASALALSGETELSRRVLCDYRETLSDLLLARVRQIAEWSGQRGSDLRMQAHGAPANILDMYGTASIPETEVFGANHFDIPGFRRDTLWARPDPHSILVNRFASSAAHVAGRNLVISESFTWLRNHFHTALSHVKAEADLLLLSGINGIYYHGTCYAPEKTSYPGWLFYASTQFNYRNSIFRDIPRLNTYLTRCQGILQSGKPFNDVLLYWPVYDQWMSGGEKEMRFRVHNPEWIDSTACGQAASWMIQHGYSFDFISDTQLKHTTLLGRDIISEGGNRYRTILIPAAACMDHETLQHLVDLAKQGANILFWRSLPEKVPGLFEYEKREEALHRLTDQISLNARGTALPGSGTITVSDKLEALMQKAELHREELVDHDLQFIRRRNKDHISYFIVNQSGHPTDTLLRFSESFISARIMDPMTGRSGVATPVFHGRESTLHLQLVPGESRIVQLYASELKGEPWPVLEASGTAYEVQGEWMIEFMEGGPLIPEPVRTYTLKSWTEFQDAKLESFAGAARYSIEFLLPEVQADSWILDLGDVRESARVWINDRPVGILVSQPYRTDIAPFIHEGFNKLSVEVTNLSANRIRDLDRRAVPWKKFEDINIVNHKYEPFDASDWPLELSGLLGPVQIIPFREIETNIKVQ
jgi:hypothetical protein